MRSEFFKKEQIDGELAKSQLLDAAQGVIEFIGQELTVSRGHAGTKCDWGNRKSFKQAEGSRFAKRSSRRKREATEELPAMLQAKRAISSRP